MSGLTARKIEEIPTNEGIQAHIALVEPNGDEHIVSCRCGFDGSTDITEFGTTGVVAYLSERYGAQIVRDLTRQTTLTNL